MSEKKKSNNVGCIVAIVLFVIAILVFSFMMTSKESTAEGGSILMKIFGFGIALLICKLLFIRKSDDTGESNYTCKSNWGCILTAIVVSFFFVTVSELLSDDLNYFMGVVFETLIATGLGIFIYFNCKDQF